METVIAIWLVFFLVHSTIGGGLRWEPFPTCLSCIPYALLEAPGIGFELSQSYGIISVRFENGTITNFAKVEGGEDYRALMKRLSGHQEQISESEIHHQFKLQDTQNILTKQTISSSTAVFRSDVEILGEFIKLLRTTTELRIGATVDLAVAARPDLPFLQQQMVEDAFDLAGMTHLRSYKFLQRIDPVHQPVAGLAGLGYGICENWKDIRICEDEDTRLPFKQTIAISFTDDALVLSNTAIVGLLQCRGTKEVVHRDLGFNIWSRNPEDSTFWDKVREAIKNTPVSYRKPDLLLLFGNVAANAKFQEAVKSALDNMELAYLYDDWQNTGQDPTYAAAQGAAMIAKVWQGSEWNCLQRCHDDEDDDRPDDDGPGITLRQMYEKRAQWDQSCMMGDCPWHKEWIDSRLLAEKKGRW